MDLNIFLSFFLSFCLYSAWSQQPLVNRALTTAAADPAHAAPGTGLSSGLRKFAILAQNFGNI